MNQTDITPGIADSLSAISLLQCAVVTVAIDGACSRIDPRCWRGFSDAFLTSRASSPFASPRSAP